MPFGESELNQMDIQTRKQIKIFRPRPSLGWLWLVLMAVIIFAIAIAPMLAMGLSSGSVILTVIISSVVALAFLVLAFWFPTMRYELGQDELTLRYIQPEISDH
jgi:cytosine/uracil/thiamine/allantoin permease